MIWWKWEKGDVLQIEEYGENLKFQKMGSGMREREREKRRENREKRLMDRRN